MKKVFILICLLLLVPFTGCIQVAEDYYTIGHNGATRFHMGDEICQPSMHVTLPNASEVVSSSLDDESFTLLSWNIFKGARPGWTESFTSLSHGCDLITLQEGYITQELLSSLKKNGLTWDMAAAFTQNSVAAGVLTASRIKPEALCSFWEKEPLLGIPKTAMVTRYSFNESPENLLMVNIHMINFTMGTEAFTKQLNSIHKTLENHDGPIVLAGDFNTWNDDRKRILLRVVNDLALSPISYHQDQRTKFLGEIVDHVFTRGLITLEAHTVNVDVSDHNPILARFALAHRQSDSLL